MSDLPAQKITDEALEPFTTYQTDQDVPGYYMKDPVGWCEDILGQKNYDMQEAILTSIAMNQKTTIKSAPSVGKTHVMAEAILWFYYNYFPCKVLTTAPTARQVRGILWATIRRLHVTAANRGQPLGGKLLQTALYSEHVPDWFCEGFSTSKEDSEEDVASKLTGYHAPNLLIVVDDAHGVDNSILKTIDEMLITGYNCKLVMIGNATVSSGFFYNSFRAPGYNRITITGYDCINVKEKRNAIPGLVSYEYVRDMEDKLGKNSAIFKSRVMAEFPKETPDTLIPLAWVEAAVQRWKENAENVIDEQEVCACDPARSEIGDHTSILWRKGHRVLRLFRRQGQSTMETTGMMVQERNRGCALALEIDGLGVGIYDRLEEQGINCVPVNEGSKTDEKDKNNIFGFVNMRSYLWWQLREGLDPDGEIKAEIPDDDILIEDLTTPKYKTNSSGKIELEKKESIVKRLGRSPDVGDSYAISMAAYTEDEVVDFDREDVDREKSTTRRTAEEETLHRHFTGAGAPRQQGFGLRQRVEAKYQKPPPIKKPDDDEDEDTEIDDDEIADFGTG